MHPMIRAVVGVGLLVAMTSAVCAEERAVVDVRMAKLRADVTALVGTAKCANLVNCRILALGIDPCGGPAEYVAYSWLSTEKAALETKVAEYNFALEDAQKAGTAVGACTALPEPVAACVNSRCVIPAGR
jgi:hypothetical protein